MKQVGDSNAGNLSDDQADQRPRRAGAGRCLHNLDDNPGSTKIMQKALPCLTEPGCYIFFRPKPIRLEVAVKPLHKAPSANARRNAFGHQRQANAQVICYVYYTQRNAKMQLQDAAKRGKKRI